MLETLRQIMRSLNLHSRYLVKRYGLTGPQLFLINEIASHGPINPGKLAFKTCISSATITNITERLATNGLIRRDPDPSDRRRILLSLTPLAHTLLGDNPLLLQSQFLLEFERLDAAKQEELIGALHHIARMMLSAAVPTHPLSLNGAPTDDSA